MFFKFLIFIILSNILLKNTFCDNSDTDDLYLHLFHQIENTKRSLEIMNTRLDVISEKYSTIINKIETKEDFNDNSNKSAKPIFDIRVDDMPSNCYSKQKPSTCSEAMKCTRSSGIYNLTDINYSNKTFTVYCDYKSYDGDWLYILKIVDGTEYFNRSWNDYVNGFGNINGEFWIGLEKLYALTNFYGPQELNVHLENFEGRKAFTRHDNFVVGSGVEQYKLKSLGRYFGNIGDLMYQHVGYKFSTFDNDFNNCAKLRKGGFWYNSCGEINPTGPYLRGKYSSNVEGSYWNTFEGLYYSPKTIIFMIRRRSSEQLD